jgi:trehalose/maltose transport system permease protein
VATETVRPARARRGGPARTSEGRRAEARLAFYLLIPTGIVLAVIIAYPVLRALWLSLHSDARFGTSRFVGLRNYSRAFTGTGAGDFWPAFWFTTQLTIVTVILELVIGFAMALIMNRAFKGRGLVRASVLVPWAIPTAVAAKMWEWNFTPDGVVNQVFHTNILWTAGHWSSFWAIVVADVWKTAPFIALLVLAGLQIIPDEVYEAAKVDGATWLQSFRRITLPLVKSAVIVALLFRLLDVLRIFDLPFILTNGANQTETLSTLSYKESIQNVHPSYGSTLATITFVYIVLAAFFVNLAARADVVKTQSSAGVR